MDDTRSNEVFKLVAPSPDDIHTDPGDDVTLPCHLCVVAMEVKWLKRTECIYWCKDGQGTEGRGYEGRVSVLTEDLQRGDVSLRLRDVTHSESGLHRCQVTHEDYKVEETLWLYVKRIREKKVPLRRANSASVFVKPNVAGQRTSESPPECVSVPKLVQQPVRRTSIRQMLRKSHKG